MHHEPEPGDEGKGRGSRQSRIVKQVDCVMSMDLILNALLMLLGGGLGALLGSTTGDSSVEIMVLTSSLGAIIGTLTGYGLLAAARSINRRRNQEPQQRKTAPAHYPGSFRSRLARFAGKEEQEVLKDDEVFHSTMPFWTAVDVLRRIPPKSAHVIRQILLSIRRTLSR